MTLKNWIEQNILGLPNKKMKDVKYIKNTDNVIEIEFKTESGKKINFRVTKPKANIKIVSKH